MFPKLPRITLADEFFASSFKLKRVTPYLPWIIMSCISNLKSTSRIKWKLFLWTKFLDNLLLTEYLISITATLANLHQVSLLFSSLLHTFFQLFYGSPIPIMILILEKFSQVRLRVTGKSIILLYCNIWITTYHYVLVAHAHIYVQVYIRK